MKCPLTGKTCNNKRVIQVTEVENNSSAKILDLCSKCGVDYIKSLDKKKEKKEVKIINSPEELMEVLGLDSLPPSEESIKSPCPGCGMTMDEFNRVGRFGCAECYSHYVEEFVDLAGPFHGTDGIHIGKTPKNRYVSVDPGKEHLKYLKLKFAQALEYERYEEAAEYKKQIEELEFIINKIEED